MGDTKPEGVATLHDENVPSNTTSELDKKTDIITEKISSVSSNDSERAVHDVVDHPPMTFRRGMVLLSLVFLLVTSSAPNFFLTAALCMTSLSSSLIVAYTVADIGGENSVAWVGMSNTLATAAAVPFAGAVADLLGRRYVALLGAGLVIIGCIVVGIAQRVEVAIGGMAIVGVGAGLAEVVAGAAVAEMAPVKSRGKYMGTAFIFILPFGACSTFGFTSCDSSDISSIVFCEFDLEMGSLDLGYPCGCQFCLCLRLLSSSSSTKFSQPHST
jgi:hypothetical protein